MYRVCLLVIAVFSMNVSAQENIQRCDLECGSRSAATGAFSIHIGVTAESMDDAEIKVDKKCATIFGGGSYSNFFDSVGDFYLWKCIGSAGRSANVKEDGYDQVYFTSLYGEANKTSAQAFMLCSSVSGRVKTLSCFDLK